MSKNLPKVTDAVNEENLPVTIAKTRPQLVEVDTNSSKKKIKKKEKEAIGKDRNEDKTAEHKTKIPSLIEVDVRASKKKIMKKRDEASTTTRLYVHFKKPIDSTGIDPKSLHSEVMSVRLPRKGLRSKFCFLIFRTKESAQLAEKEIRERGDVFVRVVTTEIKSKKPEKAAKPKVKVPKLKGKQAKEAIQQFWA